MTRGQMLLLSGIKRCGNERMKGGKERKWLRKEDREKVSGNEKYKKRETSKFAFKENQWFLCIRVKKSSSDRKIKIMTVT